MINFRTDNDGGKYFFGEHYDLETAKKLYNEEAYDNEEVVEITHCYVHFGIFWDGDERLYGWSIHFDKPRCMKGYKKATELLFKRDILLREKMFGKGKEEPPQEEKQ